MLKAGYTDIPKGWRNERFPVYGPSGEVVLEIKRSASALFGILTSGVQMMCYAMILEATEEASIGREIIESNMRYVGAISYFHMKDSSIALGCEGGSTAVLLSEVEYLYELQLDEGVVPRPMDS